MGVEAPEPLLFNLNSAELVQTGEGFKAEGHISLEANVLIDVDTAHALHLVESALASVLRDAQKREEGIPY